MSGRQGEFNFSNERKEKKMSEKSGSKSDDYQEPEEFQEAMDRLEEVTSELESGDLPL
ncbi:MAG: exodeoxyribonuclease VII small subunit, partial [bacterium]